jgi:hypothetical protein
MTPDFLTLSQRGIPLQRIQVILTLSGEITH